MTSTIRILILRTSAMGDVVMASPLAEGLRSRYPDARICWLAEPQVAPLLEGSPALDSVLIWPKMRWKELFRSKQWLTLFREMNVFIRKLRAEQFTLVIDAQGLFRTRLLAWLSQAPERIGLVSREPGRFLMTRLIQRGDVTCQMGSEYFHLLKQLGIDTADLRQSIHLSSASFTNASEVLASSGVHGNYIAFAPFTTRPQKHWFEQQWIQLAHEVTHRLALPIVWLGGPGDRSSAEILAAAGGGITLAGQTSLATSAAIIARSAVLVGVDTGLTHLGTAFNMPTVALFGSTCPYTHTRNPNTVVLYHQLSCSPCRRKPTCNGQYDCMQAITVAEVMQVMAQLLEEKTVP